MATELTLDQKMTKLISLIGPNNEMSKAINEESIGFDLKKDSEEFENLRVELSKYDFVLLKMDSTGELYIKTVSQHAKAKFENRMVEKKAQAPMVEGWSQDGDTYIAPEFIDDVVGFMKHGCIVGFVGPAGSGKTQCAYYIAETMYNNFGHKKPMPVYVLNCPQASEKVLFGKDALKNGETYYKEGILVKSARTGLDAKGNVVGEPSVLVLDEFPGINPMVGLMLNTVLADVRERREIVLPNETSFFAHPGWKIIVTGNSRGRGQSNANMSYTAQQDALDASTLDRIAAMFIFSYSKEAEMNMMKKACIPSGEISLLFNFFDILRNAKSQGKIQEDITTRTVKNICRAYNLFKSISKAIKYTMINRCNEDSEGFYLETFKTVFGRAL